MIEQAMEGTGCAPSPYVGQYFTSVSHFQASIPIFRFVRSTLALPRRKDLVFDPRYMVKSGKVHSNPPRHGFVCVLLA